jgi:hypothetical protein
MSRRIIALVLFLFIMVVGFGCRAFTPGATPKPLPDPEVETYRVYSALIEARYVANTNVERIVIQDQTSLFGSDDLEARLKDVQQAFKLKRDILDSFKAQNQTAQPLIDSFKLSVEVVLVSQDELQKMFADPQKDGWETFYEQYPNSQGRMELSGVGFNKDMTQALVYVGNMSYSLAGAGYYYLLENQDGTWVVINETMVWIS